MTNKKNKEDAETEKAYRQGRKDMLQSITEACSQQELAAFRTVAGNALRKFREDVLDRFGAEFDEEPKHAVHEQVYAALKDGSMTIMEIATALYGERQVPYNAVSGALYALRKQGVVRRVGPARYERT